MGLDIFISYATIDTNLFSISSIASGLRSYKQLDHVHYWEEGMKDDIIDYMNYHVGSCDIFLLFCSPNSLNSDQVKLEWENALQMQKAIIPIFTSKEYIPPLLHTKLGYKYDVFNLDRNISELYRLIMKKSSNPVSEDEEIFNKTPKSDLEVFRRQQVQKEDILALKMIQEELGKDIYEFRINDEHFVVFLDLSQYDIKRVPNSLKELKKIEEINFPANVFRIKDEIQKLSFDGIVIRVDGKRYDKSLFDTVAYNDARIYRWESDVMRAFEKSIKKKILKVPEVHWNTFGFSVRNNHVTGIGLKELNLSTLPENIGNLTELTSLWVSRNNLSILPSSICNLYKLRILDLFQNQIEFLPENIGDLKALKILYLHENKLTYLPESFKELKSLLRLDLSSNDLTTLPDGIGELTELRNLSLCRDRLLSLPNSIGNLTNLEHLDLSYNDLTEIPNSIYKLKNLEELDLSRNQIHILPDKIDKLEILKILKLHANKIKYTEDLNDKLKNLSDHYCYISR